MQKQEQADIEQRHIVDRISGLTEDHGRDQTHIAENGQKRQQGRFRDRADGPFPFFLPQIPQKQEQIKQVSKQAVPVQDPVPLRHGGDQAG